MDHPVITPNAQENHKWQAALNKSDFGGTLLSGRPLATITPNKALYLSGGPVDRFSARIHGKLSNRAKHRVVTLGCALYAMAQAAVATDSSQVCGVIHSMSNTPPKVAPRYKQGIVADTGLARELKLLEEHGFVTTHKGFKGKDSPQGLSTLWFAATRLIDWLAHHEKALEVGKVKGEFELLRLRSLGSKSLEDYTDTDDTTRIRDHLERTNQARQSYLWAYSPLTAGTNEFTEDAKYTLSNHGLACHRVFNGDFESGGRFYCPAQSLRKAERGTLTIDSQPTIELDYKSLHLRMLYNMNQLPAPKDCYNPLGNKTQEERQQAKITCMIVINTDSRSSAVKALSSQGFTHEDAEKTVGDFESDHPSIMHTFYQSSWKQLQYIDSQLAESVLESCCKARIPVMPIHDSFITQTHHSVELEKMVRESYREVLGFDAEISFGDMPDMDWLRKELGL